MNKKQAVQEWVESINQACDALQAWRWYLIDTATADKPATPEAFDAALCDLCDKIGDTWTDRNPAGGGLDMLFEALTSQNSQRTVPLEPTLQDETDSPLDPHFDPDLSEWVGIALDDTPIFGRTRSECWENLIAADTAYLNKTSQERWREKWNRKCQESRTVPQNGIPPKEASYDRALQGLHPSPNIPDSSRAKPANKTQMHSQRSEHQSQLRRLYVFRTTTRGGHT